MKSAPHLEPQRWQRILEHIADAKRKENTSAPQSAILTQTAQGFQPRGFQNHIPARGRKQLKISGVTSNPLQNFKTTSPQGDGNFIPYLDDIPIGALFQNHIPARGRKPCIHADNSCCCNPISKPHPRKGTETHNSSLPRASRGRGTAKRWKGRLERSTHLYREKVISATSAPTGSHRSPPPPFRRER